MQRFSVLNVVTGSFICFPTSFNPQNSTTSKVLLFALLPRRTRCREGPKGNHTAEPMKQLSADHSLAGHTLSGGLQCRGRGVCAYSGPVPLSRCQNLNPAKSQRALRTRSEEVGPLFLLPRSSGCQGWPAGYYPPLPLTYK